MAKLPGTVELIRTSCSGFCFFFLSLPFPSVVLVGMTEAGNKLEANTKDGFSQFSCVMRQSKSLSNICFTVLLSPQNRFLRHQ